MPLRSGRYDLTLPQMKPSSRGARHDERLRGAISDEPLLQRHSIVETATVLFRLRRYPLKTDARELEGLVASRQIPRQLSIGLTVAKCLRCGEIKPAEQKLHAFHSQRIAKRRLVRRTRQGTARNSGPLILARVRVPGTPAQTGEQTRQHGNKNDPGTFHERHASRPIIFTPSDSIVGRVKDDANVTEKLIIRRTP